MLNKPYLIVDKDGFVVTKFLSNCAHDDAIEISLEVFSQIPGDLYYRHVKWEKGAPVIYPAIKEAKLLEEGKESKKNLVKQYFLEKEVILNPDFQKKVSEIDALNTLQDIKDYKTDGL